MKLMMDQFSVLEVFRPLLDKKALLAKAMTDLI